MCSEAIGMAKTLNVYINSVKVHVYRYLHIFL